MLSYCLVSNANGTTFSSRRCLLIGVSSLVLITITYLFVQPSLLNMVALVFPEFFLYGLLECILPSLPSRIMSMAPFVPRVEVGDGERRHFF